MSTRTVQQQERLDAKRASAAREERQRRIVVAAVVATVVIVLGVVGALAFGGSGSSPDERYSADPEAFVLPGLLDETETVALADHLGTPVVVNFFASWCVYCNEELPGFVQVATATAGEVDFIGVDSGDPGDGVAMAERFDLAGAGFALAEDVGTEPPSDLWASYGSQGLPVTAFYDASGTLVDFSGGMLTQDELEQRIEANFGIQVSAEDAAELGAPVIPLIPRGAYELLARGAGDPTFVPLDLRPADEFAAGHLPDAANVPYDADGFDAAIADLEPTASYVVYDADGTDSGAAADAMHAAGFTHVYEIEGGFSAWTGAGLPTSP